MAEISYTFNLIKEIWHFQLIFIYKFDFCICPEWFEIQCRIGIVTNNWFRYLFKNKTMNCMLQVQNVIKMYSWYDISIYTVFIPKWVKVNAYCSHWRFLNLCQIWDFNSFCKIIIIQGFSIETSFLNCWYFVQKMKIFLK